MQTNISVIKQALHEFGYYHVQHIGDLAKVAIVLFSGVSILTSSGISIDMGLVFFLTKPSVKNDTSYMSKVILFIKQYINNKNKECVTHSQKYQFRLSFLREDVLTWLRSKHVNLLICISFVIFAWNKLRQVRETKEIMGNFSHHDKLSITVNENCAIVLPEDLLQQLLLPHKLSFYCFAFMDSGSATYTADLQNITISDGELVFGLPNQIFVNPPKKADNQDYKVGFDENTLALLPHSYPFLVNPLNSNKITFSPEAKQRVKAIFSILFQLLHSPGKQKNTEIILAHLNSLLTEFNSAYFEHDNQDIISNTKLSKYIAFKLAVETHLTEQHDVHTIAEKLAMTTSSLYGIVKDFSGISPKEWITNRLILEAQRKLQYSTLSVKELAYELGFNDPHYFSRLFKKSTGKSVSAFLADLRDLSSK